MNNFRLTGTIKNIGERLNSKYPSGYVRVETFASYELRDGELVNSANPEPESFFIYVPLPKDNANRAWNLLKSRIDSYICFTNGSITTYEKEGKIMTSLKCPLGAMLIDCDCFGDVNTASIAGRVEQQKDNKIIVTARVKRPAKDDQGRSYVEYRIPVILPDDPGLVTGKNIFVEGVLHVRKIEDQSRILVLGSDFVVT